MDDSKSRREQRLAAALRANLRRRKQQAREQQVSEGAGREDSGELDEGDDETAAVERTTGKVR